MATTTVRTRAGLARTAGWYRHWRFLRERLVRFLISCGGLGVIGIILLMMLYLLSEVLPLFLPAKAWEEASYPLPLEEELLFLSLEEQAEVAMGVGRSGSVKFFRAADGAILLEKDWFGSQDVPVTAHASSPAGGLLGVGRADGTLLLARHRYRAVYGEQPGGQRRLLPLLEYPYGAAPLRLDTQGAALRSLALGGAEEDGALNIVAQTGDGRLLLHRLEPQQSLWGEGEMRQRQYPLPKPDFPLRWMLLDSAGGWLFLVAEDGSAAVLEVGRILRGDAAPVVWRGALPGVGAQLRDATLLTGGLSLLTVDAAGDLGQYFLVRQEGGWRLRRVRSFQAATGAMRLLPERRRKGFASVGREGRLEIFHSTAAQRVLSHRVAQTPLSHAAIAPRSRHFLFLTEDRRGLFWRVRNEHPEVSFSTLWSRVWYEFHEKPEYRWQSSSASDDFEPKYSLVPLSFGTLKAAFYSMLFAAVLGLCGAVFTAYFMAPAMRRKIKPTIEFMEALPTVVLGFLAGLWFAPFLEKHLPGVILFLLVPFPVLLFAALWQRLPRALLEKIPDGWQAALLIPVVLFWAWCSLALSAPTEALFFNGSMPIWLTQTWGIGYDQRNAIVVGVAMGFAVIPTIFSITEDAVFSVPKHLSYGSLALGATRWQTLVRVVIPTASPAIFSALMIGFGRAIGETMIVLMATGNTPIIDANIFEGMRTLSANIAVEIGEAERNSSHFRILFLSGLILFMLTFFINTCAEIVRHRLRRRYGSL